MEEIKKIRHFRRGLSTIALWEITEYEETEDDIEKSKCLIISNNPEQTLVASESLSLPL